MCICKLSSLPSICNRQTSTISVQYHCVLLYVTLGHINCAFHLRLCQSCCTLSFVCVYLFRQPSLRVLPPNVFLFYLASSQILYVRTSHVVAAGTTPSFGWMSITVRPLLCVSCSLGYCVFHNPPKRHIRVSFTHMFVSG